MTTVIETREPAVVPATTLPPLPSGPSPRPRPVGVVSRNDLLTVAGAGLSAVSLTMLLFGPLAPFSGRLGFFFVAVALFIAIYAFLVSLTNDRPVVVNAVVSALLVLSWAIAGIFLFWVIGITIWRGREALRYTNTFTRDMSLADANAPLDVGGLAHAAVGSLIIVGLALIFTVPLGIACAVYLNETRTRTAELVRIVVTAMTALPSIVAGLFILATWILILGFPRSGLAAAFAITIMMLPIIIRSADVVLRLVPGNLREAAAALGAPAWRTTWHVVLPTARSGLATSVILGVARGVGETAPILLTSGFATSMNLNATQNPMMSLTLATWDFIRVGTPTMVARAFASATVLLFLVLILFSLARVIGGRGSGGLSPRQVRRAEAASALDVARFRARASGVDS